MFLRNFLSQFFLVKRLVAHWLWKTMPFEMLDNYWRYNNSHPHSILRRLGPSAREHFGGRFGYGGAKKKNTLIFPFPFFFAQHAWTEISFIHIKDEMVLNSPVDG